MFVQDVLGPERETAPDTLPTTSYRRPLPWDLKLPSALNAFHRRYHVEHNRKGNYPILPIVEENNRTAIIAAFGPSLDDTLEELKEIDGDIISVSGAHDYLISKGIVPKYHVEMDPRAHKAKFLQNPHPDVTYCLSSSCDPQAFLNVMGQKVYRWNLHTHADDDDAFYEKVDGPEWFSLDVGCSVGHAAVVVGGCLGYRNFELFGMDCSKKNGARHAGNHHGPFQRDLKVEVAGRLFDSTPQMVAAARDFISLCARMGQVGINMHGDGLLQHWIDAIITKTKPSKEI
jgi:hypothetical protein